MKKQGGSGRLGLSAVTLLLSLSATAPARAVVIDVDASGVIQAGDYTSNDTAAFENAFPVGTSIEITYQYDTTSPNLATGPAPYGGAYAEYSASDFSLIIDSEILFQGASGVIYIDQGGTLSGYPFDLYRADGEPLVDPSFRFNNYVFSSFAVDGDSFDSPILSSDSLSDIPDWQHVDGNSTPLLVANTLDGQSINAPLTTMSFVPQSVPEPPTLALLGAGLFVFAAAWVVRRRQTAKPPLRRSAEQPTDKEPAAGSALFGRASRPRPGAGGAAAS